MFQMCSTIFDGIATDYTENLLECKENRLFELLKDRQAQAIALAKNYDDCWKDSGLGFLVDIA